MKTLGRKLAAIAFGIPQALSVLVMGTTLSSCAAPESSASSLTSLPLTPAQQAAAVQRKRLEPLRSEAEAHRKLVLADLGTRPDCGWCGSYAWSTGLLHKRFDLSSKGFWYEYSHCTGTAELAYGTSVETSDGRLLHLRPTSHVLVEPPEQRRARSDFRFEENLYCVPWGEERFLVPASLMEEFCRLVHAPRFDAMKYADYPRKLRSDDDRPFGGVEPAGLPDVPPQFRHLLPH